VLGYDRDGGVEDPRSLQRPLAIERRGSIEVVRTGGRRGCMSAHRERIVIPAGRLNKSSTRSL
jgi:hypothetical protein